MTTSVFDVYCLDVEFIETNSFLRTKEGLINEDELLKLQTFLLLNPQIGTVIPGSRGLRKLRWAGRGRGKRGGLRIIYYWFRSRDQIFLLLSYSKKVKDDLSPRQLRILKQLIEE